METPHEVLAARVTRVESTLSHIETSLTKITKSIDEISRAQRPNMGILIAASGFVLAAGGGLWALAIRPVEGTTKALITKTTDNARRLEVLEQDQVRGAERSEVLRTRMEAAESLAVQRDQYNWILMQIVYRKTFGEELPPKDVWPTITRPGEIGMGKSGEITYSHW